MAKEVKHEAAYDIYYVEFSNFTHGNVKLADRFLRFNKDELYWSMRADEIDVAYIFSYANDIFSCFLSLFGKQFELNIEKDIESCSIL